MKKSYLFLALMITLLVCSACSSDDDNSNNENSLIIAIWSENRYKANDFNNQDWYNLTEPITLEFQSNGNFIDKYDGVVEGNGTWTISGNNLTMDWSDEIQQREILILNETTLQLKETFENGDWEIYEYVK
ncbi:lipocalin family protein [Winogradskyella sediminis]|uniref:lipocalin family protein n=1 Tax=Winogradskyella sediminis TaxID=1382466 RepID=UPI000E24A65D|nr:lipocalin family protein [Winogradskyella sediminis]REG86025.1 lipocalin-like protein [Winogradskyella sediminis]